MDRMLFDQYAEHIRTLGASGADSPDLVVRHVGRDVLRYIPFEHVNADARLVIVGISPGPNQLKLAYADTQRLLLASRPTAEILREVKKAGAFGGPAMKPNLLRFLRHFQFERILGIDAVESLWADRADLLHATSVIPHAAFTRTAGRERMFAGTFAYVMASPLFRECFMDNFVETLRDVNPDALYVGLGDCPEAALRWCVDNGYLKASQVLGAFCHPSTNGGSAPNIYLREKTVADLKPTDPVRHRVASLDQAYARMAKATSVLLGQVSPEPVECEQRQRVSPESVMAVQPSASIRKHRTLPTDPFVAKVIEMVTAIGFTLVRQSQYLAEFVAAGQAIYLLKKGTALDSIRIMVHPGLARDDVVHLAGEGSVSTDYRHHSSMSKFPSRIHTGKAPITYGWLISADGLEQARTTLEGLLQLLANKPALHR